MTVLKSFDFAKSLPSMFVRQNGSAVYLKAKSGREIRINSDYLALAVAAYQVLKDENPMTVRQIYYQLFSRGWVKNSQRDYKQVVSAMVEARQRALIPWDWVEDRLRMPREMQMWDDMNDFMTTVRGAYRRDVWANQSSYIEVWVEKDALSGIFQDELQKYGVTLNVGRGYDGWSSIRNASLRFKEREKQGKETHIAYFGDFDPSGEDMVRSLRDRLAFFGCTPELIKNAITKEDIEEYNLPPEPGKEADSRSAAFIEEHGRLIQVELDALPVRVLRERINEAVENVIDLEALGETRKIEKAERAKLSKFGRNL